MFCLAELELVKFFDSLYVELNIAAYLLTCLPVWYMYEERKLYRLALLATPH